MEEEGGLDDFTPETLAALLDDEIARALDRLRAARDELERDIAALKAEQARRAQERQRRLEQYEGLDFRGRGVRHVTEAERAKRRRERRR